MAKLILIDGNSIMNRAFYGIMGSKMLTTSDGRYTNAVYGFLAIMFKILEDEKPEYLAVTFDLKAPTARHKMYEQYKANRKGMPNELAEQMPMIKEILRLMNIAIIEKEGYEGDDVIGTLSVTGEKNNLDVIILSGDRDTFQLVTEKVKVKIPRTKAGKTENELFDMEKVHEVYGLSPKSLIDVKGLMGDSSDNIPGVPGVGEKTALSLIQQFNTIENLYEQIKNENDGIKGKLREKLIENKELAILSKKLGKINLEVPITEDLSELKVEDWDKEGVFNKFKELKFNRYIERFNLNDNVMCNLKNDNNYDFEEISIDNIENLLKKVKNEMIYYISSKEDINSNNIIKRKIESISIYLKEENKVYYISLSQADFVKCFKEILENEDILKIGYNINFDYVLLKQIGISLKGIEYDVEIAAYLLNPSDGKYEMKNIAMQYANIDIDKYESKNQKEQINLFDDLLVKDDVNKEKNMICAYAINKIKNETIKKLEEIDSFSLFKNIEMPLVQVLGEMQYKGMNVDKQELVEFGQTLKAEIELLTEEIYELSGEKFNINSTQQLGVILFEKLKLPVIKKTKNGYSTDIDVLEKLENEHEIISKIIKYRTLMKLNSTYVEGMINYINDKTGRIHSYFHQTITATGRLSSTEPNLQNIPTRFELGKQLRKVFKPEKGYIYIDADYSQIELRILAHISKDENMLEAFKNDEDIHKQVASKVLNIPINEVTKEQRSSAKAVNFGIVYGISEFGLAQQLGISRKQAKEYIEQYLEKYFGIKKFMDNIVEKAKEDGYVETLFKRKRYIPELKSNNFMIRQFGSRVAMNTPIQGTAADIMKIAMINVYNRLKKENIDGKIVLQIHDELLLEVKNEDKERAKGILKEEMENATKLIIPLKVEVSEAKDWYETK